MQLYSPHQADGKNSFEAFHFGLLFQPFIPDPTLWDNEIQQFLTLTCVLVQPLHLLSESLTWQVTQDISLSTE